MLRIFSCEQQKLTRLELHNPEDARQAIWLDLQEPDDAERQFVEQQFGKQLALRTELDDIEASARFFEDEDGLHIHSLFFFQEERAATTTVAFTIRDGRLFTLRERELPVFRLYRMRARSASLISANAYELLLDLFEVKIEQLADSIEEISLALEAISQIILQGKQNEAFQESLSKLTELEDMSWKVRLCLMDTNALSAFCCVKPVYQPSSWSRRAMCYVTSNRCCHTTNRFRSGSTSCCNQRWVLSILNKTASSKSSRWSR